MLITLLSLASIGGPTSDPLRPWLDGPALADEFAERRYDEASPEEELELLVWALDRGLYSEAWSLTVLLLDRRADDEALHGLAGLVREGDQRRWEEVGRFERSPEPLPAWSIEPSAREAALSDLDRQFEKVRTASVYQLWSDLDREAVDPYADALTEQYKDLRNHFRFSVKKVTARLFGSRSEYLRFYRRRTGGSGLHVYGFYSPSQELLAFYHDPYQEGEVVNTARHESVHLLVDLMFPGLRVPVWLNEGVASYHAGDREEATGAYTAGLLMTLLERLEENEALAFADLAAVAREDFEYEHYADSWGWVSVAYEGAGSSRLKSFWADMRSDLEPGMEPAAVAEHVNSEFASRFLESGQPDELRTFLHERFGLVSAEQKLAFARKAVERGTWADAPDAGALWLDRAQRAFDGIPSDELDAVDAQLLRIAMGIGRLGRLKDDLRAQRLGLRAIRDALRALPDSATAARGHWAVEALDALAGARGMLDGQRRPFDLYRAFVVEADARRSVADIEERELRQSVAVLVDDLLRIAWEALGATLATQPLHRRAAVDALECAVDYAPLGVEQVFDVLRLQAEVDPDDVTLAALGLCYWALGDRSWGTTLLDEAETISAEPVSLRRFRARTE